MGDDFETVVADQKMVAYWNALGLDITDAKSLFVLLDRDHTGTIDIEEFLVGMLRLKGGARSLDMAKLQMEVEWMVEAMERLIIDTRQFGVALGFGVDEPCVNTSEDTNGIG